MANGRQRHSRQPAPANARRTNHTAGEHVVLCHGRARLGPVGHPVELSAGDHAGYSADEAHMFEALEAGTAAVMLIEHT